MPKDPFNPTVEVSESVYQQKLADYNYAKKQPNKLKTSAPLQNTLTSTQSTSQQTQSPASLLGAQQGSLAAFEGISKQITKYAQQQGPSIADILTQYAQGGLKLTTPSAIGAAVSMQTGSQASNLLDAYKTSLSFVQEQDAQKKEQFNLALTQLDLAAKSGSVLTPQLIANIDTALGLPGIAKSYLETQKAVFDAQTEETQVNAAMKMINFLNALPTGYKIKVGDSEYVGLGGDVNKVFEETDAYGNVTYITVDPTTGQIIKTAQGGQVGKGFKGSSGGGSSGSGGSKAKSNTKTQQSDFGKFVAKQEQIAGKSYNVADPNVIKGLQAMQLLTNADKKKMLSQGLDPNEPSNVLQYLQGGQETDELGGINIDAFIDDALKG